MYTSEEQESDAVNEPGLVYQALALLWEICKVVLISLAIIIPIRYFIVQPFFVNGASMEETFHDNDYILIDEISYRFKDPVRGDIVVFRYPNDRKQFFIKRVVGMPGETIDIKNNKVTIFNDARPSGFELKEYYLASTQETQGSIRVKLDPNEYFVLGDNRTHSSDSRYWGPVNRSLVTGRVFARAWPLNKATFFEKPIY